MNDLTPFEKHLQHELHARVTEMQHAPVPEASWKKRSRPQHFRWLWKASAAGIVLNKLAIGGVAALMLAGASVGVKTAVTGTPDPLVWGHSIAQQTTACRSQSAGGGIGACVSSHASVHGAQVRTRAAANGKEHSTQNAANAKASQHGTTHASTLPVPSPQSVHPTPPTKVDGSIPVQPPAPTGIPSPKFG